MNIPYNDFGTGLLEYLCFYNDFERLSSQEDRMYNFSEQLNWQGFAASKFPKNSGRIHP